MTSPISLQIFDTLHDLLHLFRREIRQELEATNEALTFGELRVLVYIGRTPGCTQRSLVAHSRTDKAQIARTIAQLRKKGFISCSRKPTDRRVHVLHLSAAGTEIFARLNARRAAVAKRLLQHCPEPLQTQLLALLNEARAYAFEEPE